MRELHLLDVTVHHDKRGDERSEVRTQLLLHQVRKFLGIQIGLKHRGRVPELPIQIPLLPIGLQELAVPVL